MLLVYLSFFSLMSEAHALIATGEHVCVCARFFQLCCFLLK